MPLINQSYLYQCFDYYAYSHAQSLYYMDAVQDFTWLYRDHERATFRGTVTDGKKASITVSADIVRDRGVTASYCDNPGCRRTLRCAHVCTLLMTYIDEACKLEENERAVRGLLSAYMPSSRLRASAEAPVRLVPMVSMPRDRDEQPELSLKIGRGKLYIVKKTGDLVDRVAGQLNYSYGKQLEFVHEMSAFDEPSQALLKMVMQAVNEYRYYYSNYNQGYGYQRMPALAESIPLTGRVLDDFFDLYNGRQVDERRGGTPVRLTEEPPILDLNITKNVEGVQIRLGSSGSLISMQTGSYSYLLSRDSIIRCSEHFTQKILPLFSTLKKAPLHMDDHSMSSFCSCVLPAVQKDIILRDEDNVVASYLPDDCTPIFRLDL